MMLEFFYIIMGIGLLTLPGYALASRMRGLTTVELIGFSIVFSIAITGSMFYFVGLVDHIQPIHAYAFFAIACIAAFIHKPEKREKNPSSSISSEGPAEKIFFMLTLGGLLVLGFQFAAFPFFLDDITYDSVSYHIPLINSYATDGNIPFAVETNNAYALIQNYYPKLIEALAGGIKQVSPVYEWIPFLAFVAIVCMLYGLGHHFGMTGLWPASIFFGGSIAAHQFFSFYVDGITALFVASIILLVLKYENHKTDWEHFLPWLLLGSLAATKIAASILVIVIGITLWISRHDAPRIKSILSFLVGGGYYFIYYFFAPKPTLASTVGLGGKWVGTPFIDGVIANAGNIAMGLVAVSVFMGFYPLIVIGLVMGLFYRENMILRRIFWSGTICMIGFVLVTESNYRIDFLPRFLLPLYLIACCFTALAFKRLHQWIKPGVNRQACLVMIGLLILLPLYVQGINTQQYFHDRLNGMTYDDALQRAISVIPNHPQETVLFLNAPNGITLGLEHVTPWDYLTLPIMDNRPVCSFLADNQISFVVIFWPDSPRNDLGEMSQRIINTFNTSPCGRRESHVPGIISVYSLK